MPAQIREDDAIARSQRLCHGQPEFMIRGKRMQQNYGRAFTQHTISDLGIATFYLLSSSGLHAANLTHLLVIGFLSGA